MKLERCGQRIQIGPYGVDYNHLMGRLEREGGELMLLVPKYNIFGRLSGFYAYLSFEEQDG